MRLIKFSYRKNSFWGLVDKDRVKVLELPPFSKIKFTKEVVSLNRVRILAPQEATKIVCVGLNYKDHAKELKMKIPEEPILFIKPPSSLIGDKDKIIYPRGVRRLDYEGELALVIKRKAKNVSPQQAYKYILGYTCLNDVTARDIQKKDIQWNRAKSFDTFCPLGPWIETDIDPSNLRIRTYLNGKIKQDSSTSNFIFDVNYLVSFISKIMTLLPGDIISTGTPPGVGSMKPQDTVEVEIEKIGRLKNYVVREC